MKAFLTFRNYCLMENMSFSEERINKLEQHLIDFCYRYDFPITSSENTSDENLYNPNSIKLFFDDYMLHRGYI